MDDNKSFSPSFGTFGTSSFGMSKEIDTDAAAKSLAGLLPTTPTQETRQAAGRANRDTKAGTNPDGSKRRGPNSHRVQNMFDAITTARIPLDEAIKTHNVSVHVARQSKRFDPFPERGQIVIKTLTDDASGSKKTYIWRVPNTP